MEGPKQFELTEEEWENEKENIFRSGYRQGYIDGMNIAADRIIEMFNEIKKEKKQSTDDGK